MGEIEAGWEANFTLLTYDVRVGKTYSLVDGTLHKQTDGNGFAGRFQQMAVTSMAELNGLQDSLSVYQCLCAGLSYIEEERGTLGTAGVRDHRRTNKHFPDSDYYAQLVLIDIDADSLPPELRNAEAAGLAEFLFKLIPPLQCAAMSIRPSSSGGVRMPDSSRATEGGWHVQVIAPPARRVDILERIWAACARAGYGRIMITDAPSLETRNIVDKAMRTSSQPIFSGPPAVLSPLLHSRPDTFVQEGEVFNPDWLPAEGLIDVAHIYDQLKQTPEVQAALSAAKRAKVKTTAREQLPPDSNFKVKREVVRELCHKLDKRLIAMDRKWLGPDFEVLLYPAQTRVTVAKILANPARYDGELTFTPGEEAYRGGAQTGKLFLNGGTPTLHTQAHGGITYRLCAIKAPTATTLLVERPYYPGPDYQHFTAPAKAVRAAFERGGRYMQTGSMGTGKTTAITGNATTPGAALQKPGARTFFALPNHAKAAEGYTDAVASEGLVESGKSILHVKGYGAEYADGVPMCALAAEVAVLARNGLRIDKNVCPFCPHNKTCPTGAQRGAPKKGQSEPERVAGFRGPQPPSCGIAGRCWFDDIGCR